MLKLQNNSHSPFRPAKYFYITNLRNCNNLLAGDVEMVIFFMM